MHVFHRPRLAIIDEGTSVLPVTAILGVLAAAATVVFVIRYALVIACAVGVAEVGAGVVLGVMLARQRPFRLVWRASVPRHVTTAAIPAPVTRPAVAPISTPGPGWALVGPMRPEKLAASAVRAVTEASAPREIHIHVHGVSAQDVAAVVTAQRQGLPWPQPKENP